MSVDSRETKHCELMTSWLPEIDDHLSIVDDVHIHCSLCNTTLIAKRKRHVTQHILSKMHRTKLNPSSRDCFNEDLCETFLAANIPLFKLQNPILKQFLEKYTNKNIPDPSTLRKIHVTRTYNKVIDKIKMNISDNYIWVSADETTDIRGRCVVNIVIGILHPTRSYQPYLIASKISQTVNAEYIANVVNESISNLFPEFQKYKLLLFVSDAAPNMLKAGKVLKTTYPNLLHLSCTAHALHRICGFIREECKTTDKFISTIKNFFRKTPSHVSLYREMCPSLPLPPVPVVTRWGTWVEAALFYAQNFHSIKSVIHSLPNDSQSILEFKQIIEDSHLLVELNFINEHFKNLPNNIKYFEDQNMSLQERLSTLTSILDNLKGISGDFGVRLKKKLETAFSKNPDLHILYQLNNSDFKHSEISIKYSRFLPLLYHCPLTSCDVERTFLKLKDILSPKRTNLSEENIEKMFIVNANSSMLI